MEDVLDVYARPYDPRRPQICLDETSTQLLDDARPGLPAAPGQIAREDYEYVRQGVCNLFLVCEPLAGWRDVRVTDRRTKHDFAATVRWLLDERYPAAERVVLVHDNLNTHTLGALYEAFPPAEAHRLAQRLELHYTPKHASWLNIAEIEFSVLSRQCLARRIPDRATLEREVAAWVAERNALPSHVDWQFRTADARVKLKRLYPVFSPVTEY
jgi:hypothetical protein